MIDSKKLYNLYKKCFPNYLISESDLFEKVGSHECNFAIYEDNNANLLGLSISYKNSILLLMVDPKYRNKGIGTGLLERSESFIKNKGFDKIVLGSGTDRYLFPGVPYTKEEYLFFKKRGYTNTWDCNCLDLIKEKDNFFEDSLLGNSINGIDYNYFNETDRESLEQAVIDVGEPDWINCYKETKDSILVAKANNKIVGFMIYEKHISYPNTVNEHAGGFGCLGVIPQYRDKGIARNLINIGENKLLEDNIDCAFLGYTYLEEYYKKLGYSPDKYYWMGEKKLKKGEMI